MNAHTTGKRRIAAATAASLVLSFATVTPAAALPASAFHPGPPMMTSHLDATTTAGPAAGETWTDSARNAHTTTVTLAEAPVA